jgi:hypothetical protein
MHSRHLTELALLIGDKTTNGLALVVVTLVAEK